MENSTEIFEEAQEVEKEEFLLEKPYVKFPFYLLLMTILAIGTVGNLLVLLMIVRKKSMQTSINIYLAAIAIADMTSCFFSVFFNPYFQWLHNLVLNQISCFVVVLFIQLGEVLVPLMILALVVSAANKKNDVKKIYITLLVISIATIFFELPDGYYVIVYVSETNTKYCLGDWPDRSDQKLYQRIEAMVEVSAYLLSLAVCIMKRKSFRTSHLTRSIGEKLPQLVLVSITLCSPRVLQKFFDFNYLDLNLTNYCLFLMFKVIMYALGLAFKPIFYYYCDEDFKREFKSCTPNYWKKRTVVAYALYNNE